MIDYILVAMQSYSQEERVKNSSYVVFRVNSILVFVSRKPQGQGKMLFLTV